MRPADLARPCRRGDRIKMLLAAVHESVVDAVDGGTRVPWMWVLLEASTEARSRAAGGIQARASCRRAQPPNGAWSKFSILPVGKQRSAVIANVLRLRGRANPCWYDPDGCAAAQQIGGFLGSY
jgi:hypothetical protein